MIYVFYNNDPLADDMGGGAEHFRGLRRALARSELPHRLIAARLQRERASPDVDYVSEGAHFGAFALGVARWLRRHRSEFSDRDVFHFHRNYLYWLKASLVGRRGKTLLTYHNRSGLVLAGALGPAAPPFRAVMRAFESRAARSADGLICVSGRDRRALELEVSTAFADARLIPAAFDAAAFAGAAAPPPERARRILFAGRLAHQKNAPLAIEAFERLVARFAGDWRLTIAGDGEDAASIFRRIERSPARDRIDPIGRWPHAAMPALIADHGVVLLTSRFEASPTIVKEALTSRRWVVSTDVGDVAAVLGERRVGAIAEPAPDAIAEALAEGALAIEAGAIDEPPAFDEAAIMARVLDCYRALAA